MKPLLLIAFLALGPAFAELSSEPKAPVTVTISSVEALPNATDATDDSDAALVGTRLIDDGIEHDRVASRSCVAGEP
ncbi:MAG TPA: hypothetical protein VH165_11585 [Kofleriaceae bacterium]|jgi:hypothetical protein|nr:hypothetical protein [Kofleriaceae bacterium]